MTEKDREIMELIARLLVAMADSVMWDRSQIDILRAWLVEIDNARWDAEHETPPVDTRE